MRVRALQDSYSDIKNAILVKEGHEYNVVNKLEHRSCKLGSRESNIWYELLETGAFIHTELIFEEIFDDFEEVESILNTQSLRQ